MQDWQTWAAIAVVAVTAAIFLTKCCRQKGGGCDSCGPKGCGTLNDTGEDDT